jgi:hypothetical protein
MHALRYKRHPARRRLLPKENVMKLPYLTIALCTAFACASTTASAVALNPRGLGQVLIYPYYTVNKSQDTLLSVVNTDANGKAVKVSFREGHNGRETLSFHLFLSPHDSWTGVVSAIDAGAASGARLNSFDASCVDPGIEFPAAFSMAGFSAAAADGGPTSADRTREGMVEIIALGDIEPGSATDLAIAQSEGDPACKLPASIVDDLAAPTSGLAGTGTIVNVGEGTFYAYNAEALVGFADAPLLTATTPPGEPNLASARSAASEFPQGAVATVLNDAGEARMLDYERGIDAVSAVFMADALYNEYLVTAALGANTDWIVTFPTKQFYVDKRLYPSSITSPFEVPFAGEPGSATSPVETSTWDLFDPDGNQGWTPVLLDCHPPPLSTCPHPHPYLEYQVNVLAFVPPETSPSDVFGSRLAASLLQPSYDVTFDDLPVSESGWLKLDLLDGGGGSHLLSDGLTTEGWRVVLRGLPVTGFMAYNIINSQAAPGRLANYGGTFRHRGTFACVSTASTEDDDPCS